MSAKGGQDADADAEVDAAPPSADRLAGEHTAGHTPRRLGDAPLLEAIVENIPNMIFVKDAENLAFALFNRAGEALLATPRDALMGKNDFDFFPPADAEFFQAKDRETLANKVLVDIPEERLETKHGTRWLHTMKVPILDPEGTPIYLLGISEDITERKARETALRIAKAEAEAATAELESFSYSVAHDLRSPLRGIDGFSQALLEDYSETLDAEGQRYLRNVRTAAQQMAALIDDLLTLSRVTRGDVERERVDISLLAHRTIARLRKAEPARRVETTIADGLVAEADPRLLGVVIDNLVSNAWKFTNKRASARIEVGSTQADGELVFFVRDDGAGFDMQYVNKLFGPFQRLHGANEYGGTGVGLATVHRVVKRHGGRVWASGKVDEGATFYFVLDPKQAISSPESDA